MSEKYNPAEVESKWQAKWEEDGLYRQTIDDHHGSPAIDFAR